MSLGFLPGFEPAGSPAAVATAQPVALRPPVAPPPPAPPAPAVDDSPKPDPAHVLRFAHRVRWFERTLSPARRREIAQRPRFRNLPWIRRADEPGEDDALR